MNGERSEMKRRSFLKGFITVSAAAVMAPTAFAASPTALAVEHNYPILHGDGITDDAPALNALLNRMPVMCEGSLIHAKRGAIIVPKGEFAIRSTIKIVGQKGILIKYIKLNVLPDFSGTSVFNLRETVGLRIDELCVYDPHNRYIRNRATLISA